jgi:hypothetical protein
MGILSALCRLDRKMAFQLDPLKGLQEWYVSQCNGDWEHQYGVKIDTLDNPGWHLKIDLYDTNLSDRPFAEIKVDYEEEKDWYLCKVEKHIFVGFCGPYRLGDVISVFLTWASPSPQNGS